MQQSWIAGQTAAFNSWVSGYIDEGASYLKLKQINEQLVAQNKSLMKQVYGNNASLKPQFRKVHDTIGGGQIYNLTFPHCSKFYLTKVYKAFDKADTFFPEIDYSNWKEVYSSGRNINTSDGIEFEFVDYERIR